MKLIVNADDFGFSEGVNKGIVHAHQKGIVTSTTVMVTMPAFEHAYQLSLQNPTLKLGLHLNITLGKPLTNCPSLVKDNGIFYKPKERPDQSKFKKEEIKQEFLAQYAAFLNKFNHKPTHLDTHLYAHQVYGAVQEIVGQLSEELDIPVRDLLTKNYQRVTFLDWFKVLNNENVNDLWNKVLAHQSDFENNEIAELMVHPAFIDEYLLQTSSYNKQRLIELEILTDVKMKRFILNQRIELINFEEASLCRK